MLTLNILGPRTRPVALCPTCTYAVTQKGFSGEELTSCWLGGHLRELPFAVSECTAYTDRRVAKTVRVAGFVRPDEDGRETAVIRIA